LSMAKLRRIGEEIEIEGTARELGEIIWLFERRLNSGAPPPTLARRGRGRPRKYDWDAIVADYTAGASPRALRRKYGFHRNLVYYILKKKGVSG